MMNLIFVGVFLLIIGLSALHGRSRNLGKARIRGICMLVSATLAVILTVLTKDFWVSDSLLDGVLAETGNQQLFGDLMESSPTLATMLSECMASLIAPLLCLVYFILLSFVSWIVYLIITVIFASSIREHTEKCKHSKLRASVWGGIWGAVICIMLMVPVSGYLEVAAPVTSSILESDILTADSEQYLQETVDEYIEPINGGTAMVYRAMGGGLLVDCMTDFSLEDQDIDFSEEIGSVSSLACGAIQLMDDDIENYGSKEATAVNAVADAFQDSTLLPAIAGELIYGATDNWLNNRPFLGMEPPTAGEMSELFDPFIHSLFVILHEDAHNSAALQADIRTVADMMNIFAEHGVFQNLSNKDRLMTSLSSDGIMGKLISKLGENQSMKALIPEVTNLGVRAIAVALEIPSDKTEVYDQLFADVTRAVNYTKILPEDQRANYLTAGLKTSFDEAGVPVDEEILQCYSVSMIEDLVNNNEKPDVTTEDVQAFFAVYAMNAVEGGESVQSELDSTQGLSAGLTVVLGDTDPFANTVYAGKSEAELKKTGAAALAKVYISLKTLSFETPEEDAAEAKEIVLQVYAELLDDDDRLADLSSFNMTAKLSKEGEQAAAGLKSAETLVTKKVLMSDLLIDSKSAAERLDAEAVALEAAAITEIFVAADNLQKQMAYGSNVGLEEISTPVGQILDALQSSGSYGQEQTAGLFTAILQSETVRTSANLDVKTATLMAEKATEGGEKPSYRQTMTVVSKTVTVMTELGKEGQEISDEELVELIRNINRQSAAMLEVYATPERVESYNVAPKYSGVSSELLTKIFHFMAVTEMSEEEYAKEATALNHLLDVAFSARENSGAKYLFAKEGQVSVFSGSAEEMVEIFMSSRSVTAALRDSFLDETGNIRDDRFDVYDLGAKQPADSSDRGDCIDAMTAYYEQNPTEENKHSLYALSALFGITQDAFLG